MTSWDFLWALISKWRLQEKHREINVVNCGPVNCSSQFNENTLIFKIIYNFLYTKVAITFYLGLRNEIPAISRQKPGASN